MRFRTGLGGPELKGYGSLLAMEGAIRLANFLAVILFGALHSDSDFGRLAVALTIWTAYIQVALWGSERSAYLWPQGSAPREVVRLRLRTGGVGVCLTALLLMTLDLTAYVPAALVGWVWLLIDREYELRRHARWVLASLPRLLAALGLLLTVAWGASGAVSLTAASLLQVIGAIATRRHLPVAEATGGPMRPARTIRREMLWAGSTSAIWPTIYFADQVLLAASQGFDAAADYALAYKLLMPLIGSFALSQAVFVPQLGIDERAYRRYVRANRWIGGVMSVGAVSIAATTAILGRTSAAILVLALSPQLWVISATDPRARLMVATGHSRWVTAADGVACCVALTLYLGGIPLFGTAAAVVGTLLAHLSYLKALNRRARSGGNLWVQLA